MPESSSAARVPDPPWSPTDQPLDELEAFDADHHHRGSTDHETVPRPAASPFQWAGSYVDQDTSYGEDAELDDDVAPWAVEEYHNELLQPTPQARRNFRSGGDDEWPEEVSMSPYRRRKLTVVRKSGASQTRLAWGEPQQQSIDSFEEYQQPVGDYPVKARRITAGGNSFGSHGAHRREMLQPQNHSEHQRQQQQAGCSPSHRVLPLHQQHHQHQHPSMYSQQPPQQQSMHYTQSPHEQSMYQGQSPQGQLMFDFAGEASSTPKVFDFSSEQPSRGIDADSGGQQQQYRRMRERSDEETLQSVAEGLERYTTANGQS
jgi:hypothetical protein